MLRLADDPAVALVDVYVALGGAEILRGIDLECRPGELAVIVGSSGIGKTTLLRAVNGLCGVTRGQIVVLGSRLPGRSAREARGVWRRTGTVMQDVALFEMRTARANVELALHAARISRPDARRRAGEWLERLGLGEKLDAYPASLSGGQAQRVALARALAAGPELLVLDEPTAALDRTTARDVLDALREVADEGAAVLMSTHRDEEVATLADRRVALVDGRVRDLDRRPIGPMRIAHVDVQVLDGPSQGR